MALTINEFITECENYEYSKDFYEMTKDILSFKLQSKYIDNQIYLMEMTDSNDYGDDYFTEMPLVMPNKTSLDSSVDTVSNANTDATKKGGFFSKIKTGISLTWNTVINIFKRIWNLIKYIFRKLGDVFPKFGSFISKFISLTPTELKYDWFMLVLDKIYNALENNDNEVEIPAYTSTDSDTKSNVTIKTNDWMGISDDFLKKSPDIQFMVMNKNDMNVKSDKVTKNLISDIILPNYSSSSSGTVSKQARIGIFKYFAKLQTSKEPKVDIYLPSNAPHMSNSDIVSDFSKNIKELSDYYDKHSNDEMNQVLQDQWAKGLMKLINDLGTDSKSKKYNISLYPDEFNKLSNECKQISDVADKCQKSFSDMETNYRAQVNKADNDNAGDKLKAARLNNDFANLNRVSLYINMAASNTMKVYQGFANIMKAFYEDYGKLEKIASSSTAA